MPSEKGQSLEARLEERAAATIVEFVREASGAVYDGRMTNPEAMLAVLAARVALNEAITHELLTALRDTKTKWASAIGDDVLGAVEALEESRGGVT